MGYFKSFLSLKKITYKGISPLCVWNENTIFENKTQILAFVKLMNVKVGNYTRIGYNCNIANSEIGKFSDIARNCNIGLGQHPTNYLSTRKFFYSKDKLCTKWYNKIDFEESKLVVIGNDVWIGLNSIIKDGITIGDGAIIASGSIVTKDVPPYAIVGGNPAKIIKYRFNEETIKRLLEIEWWNLRDNDITNIVELFGIPDISAEHLNKHFSYQ